MYSLLEEQESAKIHEYRINNIPKQTNTTKEYIK